MKKYLLIVLLPIVFFTSCKKEKNMGRNQERLFEESILNQNFIVSYAIDHGADLTNQYSGYVFILSKIDYYHGPMKAIKNGVTYPGTWSSNDDYGKLIITLPDTPAELKFLSRAWRFKSKSFSKLKLNPWGDTDQIELHMTKE